MSARRALVYLLVAVGAACRAPQIPAERRYPAGTPLRAQYLTVDGTRLRMIDTGGGAPVVFIHGFGASIYSWRKTLPPVLAAGYRVIAFDNRGFGFSDKPPAPSGGGEDLYTNAAYARLVVALLDSLKLPSAVLVGHSMGGAIAAEVALRYPDRVRGLVLIDAAGFGVRWPAALRVGRWPGAGGVAAALRGRWSTERVLRSTYGDPSKVTEEDVDQYYAPVAEPGYGRSLRGVLREFRFDTLVGRMRAIGAPTLVVWGGADRWIPVRDGARLATELPRGAFVVLPGIGHAAAEENPDEVNQLLITFLKEGLPRVPENLAWSTPSSPSWPFSSRSIPRTPRRSAS
jgi:pimeloyl-ACP methyl ester carboxylesterase